MSNKTSDKNVDSIERLNKFANMRFLYGNRVSLDMNALKEVQNDLKCLLAEREIYTIHLTDEEYRKVIENAQKDIDEQKDKRIQELEAKLKCSKHLYDDCCKCLLDSIPKQVVIDLIENETIDISGFKCIAVEDLQKLLEGEK